MWINDFIALIRAFVEDEILNFKNLLFSSKYVVKGKCKMCGKCCRNIVFMNENGYVKSKEYFYKMQKKYRQYRYFRVSGTMKDEDEIKNGALTFECKFISKKNKCLIYLIRPKFCRDYPHLQQQLIYNGVDTPDFCGFYYDVNKKFYDYLK